MPVIKYLPACVDGKVVARACQPEQYLTRVRWFYHTPRLGKTLVHANEEHEMQPTPEAAIEAARRLWGCE